MTASVPVASKAKAVRSPHGKVRSLRELVGKGNTIISPGSNSKEKSKGAVAGRELEALKLETHPGYRL